MGVRFGKFAWPPIMSQCVPNWNVEDDHPRPVDLPAAPRQLPRSSAAPLLHHLPMLEYQVAELTWENGQLGMHGHGLGPPRQKPSGGGVGGGGNGTLESIVKQATCKGGSLLFDAMVPCCHSDQADHRRRGAGAGASETAATVPVATDWEPSLSGSATFGRDRMTVDSFDDLGGGFTSTSLGSAAKTTTADDRDSVSLSLQSSRVHRGGNNNNNVKEKKRGAYDETDEVEKSKESSEKFSIPTKRSRAAAIHNQSERKRRDKINQRMKTLQKLVPNSSKQTDKASMLDEVIDYLKQLQAQVQMMSRFNFTPMMQQMPIMTPMGMAAMGMGLGLGMGVFDMATARPNPLPFIPITPAQAQAQAQVPVDRTPSLMPDPLLSFLASHCHQPMTMDGYSRLQAAIYQQMQQKPPPSSSNN